MSNQSRTKNTALNIIAALALQIIVAVSGLILPRLMIQSFGSEANGLVSSITQFLSYIALLEGGAGGVIRSALYKPLANNDLNKVSGIMRASKRFYSRIALFFIIYVVGLGVIYPLISTTEFDFWYIASMVVILSLGTFLEYLFGATNMSLIIADQKARIVNIINGITVIFNIFIVYLIIAIGASIHLVKLATCVVFIFKPIAYLIYVKTHYKLDKNIPLDNEAISQRKNGLVHQIAYFLHTNIDVFLITIFMSATDVSIYVVYFAVVSGIEKIAVSLMNGSAASIGNMLAKEDELSVSRFFDKFEFLQIGIINIFFTITAILIIPFMQVYSSGFNDANYIYPLFAYILIAAEATYCIRCIYGTISTAANRYKETQVGAILEAAINIVFSLTLIHFLGLVGIVIGTFCGMFVRACFEMWYMSKHVIHRSIKKTLKCLTINVLISLTVIVLCHFINPFYIVDWWTWILRAVMVGVITILIALVAYLIFYKNLMVGVFKSFIRLFRR